GEIHVYRNQRKQRRNNDGETDTDGPDPTIVFNVVEAQRLEGTAKSMEKMKAEQCHAYHIEQYKPEAFISRIDYRVQVLVLHARVSGSGNTPPMHLIPEAPQVDNEKNENKRSEDSHVAGSPVRRILRNRVANLSTGRPVATGQNNGPDDVEQNHRIVDVGDCNNQRVGSHECRIYVERLPVVSLQQLEISDQVHHEEKNEKQSGERHHVLSPDATGEKIRKPIHSLVKLSLKSAPKILLTVLPNNGEFYLNNFQISGCASGDRSMKRSQKVEPVCR